MPDQKAPETLSCTICGFVESAERVKNVMVNRNDRDPKNRQGVIQDACSICLPMLLVAGHSVEEITWNFPENADAFMTFTALTTTVARKL